MAKYIGRPSPNMASRFVGGPPDESVSDVAAKWLHDNKGRLDGLLNVGPPPAEVGKWFQSKCVLDETGLYWSMNLVEDLACEDAAAVEGIDAWDDDGFAAFRKRFAEGLRPFRVRMGHSIDAAWEIARNAPSGISASMTGGERDSEASLRAAISLELEHGEFACPICGRTVENRAGFRIANGWLSCSGLGCQTFFVEDHMVSPRLADGLHRLEREKTNLDLVRQLFFVAHDEDKRFHVFGPADDWNAGRLEIDVAVQDGRVVSYASWNEYDGEPALRQVWTHPDYRGRRIATSLIATVADKVEKFGVESPNAGGLAVVRAGGWERKAFMIQGL